MRWLILILLFSCGKHETPKQLDLGDADGDLIVNEDEKTQAEKYIAEVRPLKAISGVVRFYNGMTTELEFSNHTDLRKLILKLAAESTPGLKPNDYFQEWSRLHLKQKLPGEPLTQERYSVEVIFKTVGAEPLELSLWTAGKATALGNVVESMNLELSRTELGDLLAGTAFLNVTSREEASAYYRERKDDSIRSKTYRVFYSDGKESKVYYVSKEFPLERFTSTKQLNFVSNPELQEFFFGGKLHDIRQWWLRKLHTGDAVLVSASMPELQKAFVDSRQLVQQTIGRINGTAQNTLTIKKPLRSKLHLKIRPTQKLRTFKDSRSKDWYDIPADPAAIYRSQGPVSGGWGRNWNSRQKCVKLSRSVVGEVSGGVGAADFLKNIRLRSGNKDIAVDKGQLRLEEKSDHAGVYWEVRLDTEAESVSLEMQNLAPATLVKTGDYEVHCPAGGRELYSRPVPVSPESEFKMNIDAYIEKL